MSRYTEQGQLDLGISCGKGQVDGVVISKAHLDLILSLALAAARGAGRTRGASTVSWAWPGSLSTSLSLAHILHSHTNIRGHLPHVTA